MKHFLLVALLFAGAAHAQTFYQCPDLTREGQTAHLGSECPGWVWSAPRRDYLIASCGSTSCSWNSNTRWRRVENVPANAAVSACTGTSSGKNCTREAWLRRDSAFPDAPPPPPPPPPPAPAVTLTISPALVYTGQPVTATWSSTNAVTCSSSWSTSVALFGSAPFLPLSPSADTRVWVRCVNAAGTYEAEAGYRVLARSPPCFPHAADVFAGRVKYDSLQTPHAKYNLKATYFCAVPGGSAQQTWATSWSEVFKRAVTENGGRFDEGEARAQCEAQCEILTDGPLKAELDAFAASVTVEQLGVIE